MGVAFVAMQAGAELLKQAWCPDKYLHSSLDVIFKVIIALIAGCMTINSMSLAELEEYILIGRSSGVSNSYTISDVITDGFELHFQLAQGKLSLTNWCYNFISYNHNLIVATTPFSDNKYGIALQQLITFAFQACLATIFIQLFLDACRWENKEIVSKELKRRCIRSFVCAYFGFFGHVIGLVNAAAIGLCFGSIGSFVGVVLGSIAGTLLFATAANLFVDKLWHEYVCKYLWFLGFGLFSRF